jgi:hypothetical protein
MPRATSQQPADWQQWLEERAAARERVRIVEAAFPGPYRRTRPRDPDEAELLRRMGTAEDLIGPSAPAKSET